MSDNSYIYSGNAEFVEGLYEDYLRDPALVDGVWRSYFDDLQAGSTRTDRDVSHAEVQAHFSFLAQQGRQGAAPGVVTEADVTQQRNSVQRLIDEYRTRGHLATTVNPLELGTRSEVASLEPANYGLTEADFATPFPTGTLPLPETAPLREIVAALRQIYCRHIGFEYAYISDRDQVLWLQQQIEQSSGQLNLSEDEKRHLLKGLDAVDAIEKYLHRKYVGQKRFSLEGGDSMIPLLDDLIARGGEAGIKEFVIGMAHRGRLNVLVNILGKHPQELFSEFEGLGASEPGSGDVKYHKGFSSDVITPGGTAHVSLAFNPSHLEIINPVIVGSVRARQERRGDETRSEVLPINIHGDAAFAGQGVVMETLNLSQARGFTTGGTIHVVINNQIGFTTSNPLDTRSTLYCTDIAKMVQAPIFHVNGEDPEAVLYVTRLALDFRQQFHRDVVIDLVCYRRHGHNEADEPWVTQPKMYSEIARHEPVRKLYSAQLVAEGVLAESEIDAVFDAYQNDLKAGGEVALPKLSRAVVSGLQEDWRPFLGTEWTTPADTTLPLAQIQSLSARLGAIPEGFELHPRVSKIYQQRALMAAGEQPMDWGYAETLAYASLLNDGYPVRLVGQDSGRGTFFHRHAVLHNQNVECGPADERHVPLQHLRENQPRFLVVDSLLSEEAVLGFEWGFSSSDPNTLVIWEAQFGDFANGAQVVIDQFISSSETKWQRYSGIVMMLPHGYEGQGPEHSSARLERYLQLCAEYNLQVCVPTTPAQMFHLLRRQMIRPYRKPLIILSPKSLLRHKSSVSTLDDLTDRGYQPVIGEIAETIDPDQVKRVVLCAGRVYFDLMAARDEAGLKDTVILRVEQLYPFPLDLLSRELAAYGQATDLVWCQEEPQNQGAWYQSQHHFRACMPAQMSLRYAGRLLSASPAAGSYHKHLEQQKALVQDALGLWQQEGA
ncbi:MAG: 2-oxoglutarate dehydrogenase E1 component [Gammaproteobacteria bacterium]|nr:2-oxoglutarate dehydrogenase E1 component [Gammaproteobacteria bacterium]